MLDPHDVDELPVDIAALDDVDAGLTITAWDEDGTEIHSAPIAPDTLAAALDLQAQLREDDR